ncbi:hypothetical protein DPSP01_008770 [Paraphaeosphaeria sporulosa]
MALQTQVLGDPLPPSVSAAGIPVPRAHIPAPSPAPFHFFKQTIPSSPLAPGEHHRTWGRDICPSSSVRSLFYNRSLALAVPAILLSPTQSSIRYPAVQLAGRYPFFSSVQS